MNKKYIYAFIRLAALAVIVGSVSFYYNDQCNYYRDKMFEAMEERDEAKTEAYKFKNQKNLLEYELSCSKSDYSDASDKLNATLEQIAWHEERWNTLVAQKNNFFTRTTDLPKRSISHYVGDSSTMVYHTSGCDLLDVIDDDDKVSVELTRFSGVQGYTKCSWCLK